MNSHKPKKRVILYWLIKYGIFFLFASFFLTFNFLIINTYYYNLAMFFLYSSILMLFFGTIVLFFKWYTTKYFLLKNNLYIKDFSKSFQINYKKIKKTGSCNTLFEKILGITNIYIETVDNKTYYLNGIRNNIIAVELIQKLNK